jgi:hypothetical protein
MLVILQPRAACRVPPGNTPTLQPRALTRHRRPELAARGALLHLLDGQLLGLLLLHTLLDTLLQLQVERPISSA